MNRMKALMMLAAIGVVPTSAERTVINPVPSPPPKPVAPAEVRVVRSSSTPDVETRQARRARERHARKAAARR